MSHLSDMTIIVADKNLRNIGIYLVHQDYSGQTLNIPLLRVAF